ncbi:TnsA-like heteromeric transposase endonuclease subunit [Sphaerisporangium sp. NBC_01403]|uniref:TnsA-like heteromeric transposase endonuclease subunit n=1 Tax=Sphaerisporangium sp. NBC_01403 TaxID=2903599 RepID=UPI0032496B4A
MTPHPIPSDSCHFAELLIPFRVGAESERRVLDLADGWTRRWTATWKVAGTEVICSVKNMASFPTGGCEPVRPFSWRTTQHHRPGLATMVSTGRLHGFESIAEQKLLLALDFTGDVTEVISQPMRLRFTTQDRPVEHTPDFLAVTRNGTWLIDVRPGNLIEHDDRIKFAASAEAALACGWQYVVVTGWRPQVLTVLDGISAQRRPLKDPLGIQDELLEAAARGPQSYGQLVAATPYPTIGRAHALHLLWHRRLGLDLTRPLNDQTIVWSCGEEGNR